MISTGLGEGGLLIDRRARRLSLRRRAARRSHDPRNRSAAATTPTATTPATSLSRPLADRSSERLNAGRARRTRLLRTLWTRRRHRRRLGLMLQRPRRGRGTRLLIDDNAFERAGAAFVGLDAA